MKHDFNIAQVAPSSAHALINEFKTHDKTSYPFHKSKEYQRFFKVVLRSDDKISGTNDNALFNIVFPQDFKDHAVCVAESFYVKGSGNALATTPYSCHIRELLHPNSYQSSNGLATDVIFTTIGYSYKTPANTTSVGCPILNGGFFNNRQINVYFTAQDDISSVVDDWILTLVFYQS